MNESKVPSIVTICPHGYYRTSLHVWVRSVASVCHRIPVDSEQEIPSHGIFTTDVDEYLLCSGTILGVRKAVCVVYTTETMTSTEAANRCAVNHFFAMCTTGERISVIVIARGEQVSPSSSSRICSNPTFCPRACFALAPHTIALWNLIVNLGLMLKSELTISSASRFPCG